MGAPDARWDGVDCTLTIRRPAAGIAVVTLAGHDVGEFRDAPMKELEKDLSGPAPLQLFIDARRAKGASIAVSGDWAVWLGSRRARLDHVSMLTGSPFVRLSADFVKRFAGLGETMRIYGDAAAFEGALADAVLKAGR